MSNGIEPGHARIYSLGSATDHDGEVVELHSSYATVAQLSELPDHDGFLVRVWPSRGTHEVLSVVVQFGPDLKPVLRRIEWDDRTT